MKIARVSWWGCASVVVLLGCGSEKPPQPNVERLQAKLEAGVMKEFFLAAAAPFEGMAAEEPEALPETMSFNIPSDCSSNPTLCCGYAPGYCRLNADLHEYENDLPRVEVENLDDTGLRLGVTMRPRIKTPNWLPVSQSWLFGWIDCWVWIDSTWSGWPHLKIYFELVMEPDAETGGYYARIKNPDAYGVTGGDIAIDGEWLCNKADPNDAAERLVTGFRQRLPGAIEQMLCRKCQSAEECENEDAACSGGTCVMPSGRCLQQF